MEYITLAARSRCSRPRGRHPKHALVLAMCCFVFFVIALRTLFLTENSDSDGSLAPELSARIDKFESRGFISPVPVLDPDAAQALYTEIQTWEALLPKGAFTMPTCKINAHLLVAVQNQCGLC